MLNCRLHGLTPDSALDAFLAARALAQQDYRLAGIYTGALEYRYLVCEDEGSICGAMPFVLYRHELGAVVHSLPFLGYGGIAAESDRKEEVFASILAFLLDFATANGVVLTTICTPPFGDDARLYRKLLQPDFERKNFYQYLELGGDVYGRMTAKFRGNLKRNVQKGARYGVELAASRAEGDLKEWYERCYLPRLTQTGCSIYPYELFLALLRTFDDRRLHAVYARAEGSIVGAGFFLNQGVSMDNFMRVVDPAYLHTQAGTMLDVWSIDLAISEGISFYNWQSCDAVGSSIYKYKEDWGSVTDHHYYLTKITGDVGRLRQTPLSQVKKAYPGIYVMPYEEFQP
jgi:hypothetical protein